MIRSCKNCGDRFDLTGEDLQLLEALAPAIGGQKFQLPPPTLCPLCRQQRRTAWRNERRLYQDNCDLCQKRIISLYAPDTPHKVYCQDCWWSDRWDACSYSRPFDFSRPFFPQYRELQVEVPRLALFNLHSTNSAYTNHSANNKNCYMGVAVGDCEDVHYSFWVTHSRDCLDCFISEHCEACYECVYCEHCYALFWGERCHQVHESLLCFDCRNCSHCLGCTQLSHKEHCVLNKQVTKTEYDKTRSAVLSSRTHFEELRAAYEALRARAPRRYSRTIHCENSFGDDLLDCKNSFYCFNCRELEDCRYMFDLGNNKLSMDCYEHGWLSPSELNYEAHAGMSGYRLLCCNICADSRDLLYCDLCQANCADCFGSISLKHKQFCLLNRQYSADEYRALLGRVIEHMGKTGEWGEFFPINVSSFPYKDTAAQDYYPLSDKQISDLGYRCSNAAQPSPTPAKCVTADQIPQSIIDVHDDILEAAISCRSTGKPFRLAAQELKFYRRYNLPLPLLHPDERYRRKLKQRSNRKLWDRSCTRCGSTIVTSFSPADPEIIYCEKCYHETVF